MFARPYFQPTIVEGFVHWGLGFNFMNVTKKRIALVGVLFASLLVFGPESSVWGQQGFRNQSPRFGNQNPSQGFRQQPALGPDGRPINPAHEETKKQAQQAYQRGEFEKSIQLATSVLNQNSRDHVALYLRASARCEIGIARQDAELIRGGIGDARKSLEVNRANNLLYYVPYIYGMTNLAGIEAKPEHAKVAVQVANQVLSLPNAKQTDKVHIHYQRARAQVVLKQLDAAILDYQKSLQLQKPGLLMAYLGLAEAYIASGKQAEAAQVYQQCVAEHPNRSLVYNSRGLFNHRSGQLQSAIADFNRAIQIDSDYAAAYANRAMVQLDTHSLNEAEASFNESLRLQPDQPVALSMRGRVKLLLGRLSDALADQQKVVSLRPNDPAAHAHVGFLLFFARQYANSLTAFDKALSMKADMPHLIAWRCCALLMSGQESVAREAYASVLEKAGSDRNWFDNLVCYQLGAISEADLLKLVKADDETVGVAQTVEAHFFVGMSKLRAGDKDGATEHFKQAVQTNAQHLSAFHGSRFAQQ